MKTTTRPRTRRFRVRGASVTLKRQLPDHTAIEGFWRIVYANGNNREKELANLALESLNTADRLLNELEHLEY